MRLIPLFLFILLSPLRVFSEPSDAEFMRMLQQKAAQAKFEEEVKNPKKPVVQPGRAVQGKASAAVTIVAFSDFQCPYCQVGAERMAEVRQKYGDKVRFMFKHYPLPGHPMAVPAAKRFEAIALQSSDKAYKFHDAVFKDQRQLTSSGEAFLDEVAKKVGANVAKMKKDMEGSKVKSRMDADMEEAKTFGVSGTPNFIVGGITISGAQPIEVFSQVIDMRLAERNVSSKPKSKK